MKVIMQMAVSLDGFVARANGDTDWVLDEEGWLQACAESDAVVIGRTTFEETGKIPKTITVVVSSTNTQKETNLDFIKPNIASVKEFKKRRLEKVLLCGGGQTNALFAESGSIDEIVLVVHPIVLGRGIKLFGSWSGELDLKLLNTNQLKDGIVQNHYQVI